MNCTREEFEKRVSAAYPNYYFRHRQEPIGYRIYAGPTQFQSTNLFGLEKEAHYIWYDGAVEKDRTGLFIPTMHISTGTYTYNLTPVNAISVNGSFVWPNYNMLPSDHDVPIIMSIPHIQKCECGAHKVSSNNHSSWCMAYLKKEQHD